MRVLLDHCVPRRFRPLLAGHQVSTAYEMGWTSLKNGELLASAATQFDVLITVDQNLQFQQNLAALPLSVIVLIAPNNRLATLRAYAPAVLKTLESLPERTLLRIKASGEIEIVPPSP